MSVIVTISVQADTDKFREYADINADVLRGISDKARALGCMSHRFAAGQDHLLVIDEWGSAEQFQQFFADPAIATVMQESGMQGEPNVSVLEPLDTADRF